MMERGAASTTLTMQEKYALDDIIPKLNDIDWEHGEYVFPSFVEYFSLPQAVRVEQNWHTDLPSGRYLLLHSLYDRYSIIATNKESRQKYILSDWFRGDCRIVSNEPRLKQRWWVFQGAFELYRFELPRTIKVLAESPAHMRVADLEYKKVVLKKNVILTAQRRAMYKAKMDNSAEAKEAFVLTDGGGNEYIIPPGIPFRFATQIQQNELHAGYKNHNGKFSVPEMLMRYEFPIDVELLESEEKRGVSLGIFRLNQFSVTKSIVAVVVGERMEPKIIEISPLLQFTLHCPKCITCGMPREDGEKNDMEADPNELVKYNNIRKSILGQLNEATGRLKTCIRLGTQEEIEGITLAHEISVGIEKDQNRLANIGDAFLDIQEAISLVKNEDDVVPFSSTQPKTFTVHACIDLTNPYNEAIDYEMNNDDTGAKSGKGPVGPSQLREALVMQAAPLNPIPKESFEKTVLAIPETLYLQP